MTSTKQASAEHVKAIAEWTKIFPEQATQNYTSSVTFMKQLTVIAVSTITYLKGTFPEENYLTETFGGMKIMSLKHKCKDELAQFISTALMQAFDAFDKKYLHQLALCFYDGESTLENLLEYFIFEYSYKDGGVSMSIRSKSSEKQQCTMESVRAATAKLLRACFVSMAMGGAALPDNCDVSLRLYYNEATPEEYQAPGYSSAADTADPLGATLAAAAKVGSVETRHHRLALRVYAREADEEMQSREAIASLNPPMMTQAEDIANTSRRVVETLRCACNNFDCEEPEPMLTCQSCGSVQHAACYGLGAGATRDQHVCIVCAERDPSLATDNTLLEASSKRRESIAIFRRALSVCASRGAASATLLSRRLGLSTASARKLVSLLVNEGVLGDLPESDTTPVEIVLEKLQAVKSRYFQTDNQDIVDRLVAETLTQEQRDPVGDTLSPLEKMSLQNASQYGRMINPEVQKTVEDSTLKQYRQALVSVENMDQDLPLSGDPVKDIEDMERKSTKRKANKEDKIVTGVQTKKSKIKRK